MQSESSLPDFFNKILQNYLKIKKNEISSSDKSFKDLIEQSCGLCDEAMLKVNQLDLFSKNESLDDLSTGSVRYLTLPAFLAFYTGQKFERDERLTSLKLAQTYYGEFLDLIESYGFPGLPKREKASRDECPSNGNPQPTRVDPEKERNERIKAHKEKKSLDERLEKFLSLNSSIVDEEILREESIALVRYWAFTAVEDLRLIKSEVELLERFQAQQGPSQQLPSRSKPSDPTQPPLVITKEKVLATLFGAGYPSVPTMTLDQFVDLQVKQGLMPAPQQMRNKTSTNYSGINGGTWRRIDPSDEAKETAEEMAAREDALEDAHSEEQRAKAQRFDAFKDEHRRGSGNRANRG